MSSSLPVLTVLCPHDGGPGATDSTGEDGYRIPPGLNELHSEFTIRITDADHLSQDLPGTQVLFLWDFFSGALEDVWDQADQLEWIHVAAAGVDKLLFPALQDSSVVLTNAQGTFDTPIAEWVLATILARAKDLQGSWRYQQQRQWVHRETRQAAGTQALIVGAGAIGRRTAQLLRAVGVEVQGVGSRAREHDPDFGTVHASTELAEVIGWADHVINAAPLTPATTGLFSAEIFAAMRPGAHLINIGRGESVDEPALIQALDSGALGFASLDVFATEPLAQDSPLWDSPQVLISAHMSGDVIGWRDTLAQQFIANARRWSAGEPLQGVVDKALGYVPGAPVTG